MTTTNEIRPLGLPKTDGYPKEVPQKVWDRREIIWNGLRTHPLGKEVTVEAMIEGMRKFHNVEITDPEMRRFLKHLVDLGYPVGSNDKGFYWGVYRGDLIPTAEQIEARVMKMADRAIIVRRTDNLLPERPNGFSH